VTGWLVAGGLVAWWLWSRRSSTPAAGGGAPASPWTGPTGPITSKADLIQGVTEAAWRWGVPPRLVLATAEVEDGLRWPPSGPNEPGPCGRTFYPMGLKGALLVDALRAQGLPYAWPRDQAAVEACSGNPACQVDGAAWALARYWRQYQSDDLVRVAWKSPAAAAAAARGQWPAWWPGTVAERWHAAVARWSTVA
jgi:hypothetical protein